MFWVNVQELFQRVKNGRLESEEELRGFFVPDANNEEFIACTRCNRQMMPSKKTCTFVDFRCNFCCSFLRKRWLQCKLATNLPIAKILHLIALFSINLTNSQISLLLDISQNTVSKLILEIQKAISVYINENKLKIGGIDHIVQLDESCIGRRKYNVGQLRQQKWVFGGVDTTTQQFFMVVVPNRTVATLGPLIEEYVIQGTEIHTDCWSAYLSFLEVI